MRINRLYFSFKNYYLTEILGFLSILVTIYFFRYKSHELTFLGSFLRSSKIDVLQVGVLITVIYIYFHGVMYYYSFKTIGSLIGINKNIMLFLKLDFVRVFLPGRSLTSLSLFFSDRDVSASKINLASSIYNFVSTCTLFILTISVIFYLLLTKGHGAGEYGLFGLLSVLIFGLIAGTLSITNKGWLYKKIIYYKPDTAFILSGISSRDFSSISFIKTIVTSIIIKFMGMAQLLIAIIALGVENRIEAVAVGYLIAMLSLAISPFLKGLGAVELTLIVLLKSYGFNITEATAITFLYRMFDFWIPFIAGGISFLLNKGNLFLRIFPAVLLFCLGIVDIVSVLTPAITDRIDILTDFLPMQSLQISKHLVLFIGILQLITSAFLLRGLRNAWYISVFLCILSLAGNLIKALDYEEALFAFGVLLGLFFTRKQYYVKADRNLQNFSVVVASNIFAAVTIYGIIGFYFLDKHHFGVDFSVTQAITNTFNNFILLNASDLAPRTHFGHFFLLSINLLGAVSILLLFYSFIKPYLFENKVQETEWLQAKSLLTSYGRSSNDYFKIYFDKLLFFSETKAGFVSYRIARNFAIVLEEPICSADQQVKLDMLYEFEHFCRQQGLKSAYYRVDKSSLYLFNQLNKKNMLIGQEAIINVSTFNLEGKDRKSMRNASNSILNKGYLVRVYEPPIKDGILQQLKTVSDNWLNSLEREEMVFSQGMFDFDELKTQTIITLENNSEKIVAFLNIIPDYAVDETTYDLIRKTEDAPKGSMDILIIELINYAKQKGSGYLNLGMVPMSGIEVGRDLPERTIKFAYEHIKLFKHYHGLRDFKEKFGPKWKDKFLVYDTHYDLFQLPWALNSVLKP